MTGLSDDFSYLALIEALDKPSEDKKWRLESLMGRGVNTIRKVGAIKLRNDVTLSEGANVTLTQSGQNIEIASTDTGVTDHGALTGLSDDDHTQYLPMNSAIRQMESDLLPDSPEVYSIGSDVKPWLRGHWQGRNTSPTQDNLGKLILGGKFPAGHPRFTQEEGAPYVDFYFESPIGTKHPRYIITNWYGQLIFSGVSADELSSIDMMGFDFPSTTFFVASHFQPAYEGLDLGSPLHPIFPVRWRDVGVQRYAFLGKTENGLPTAEETYRGVMVRVEGTSGGADKLYVCMKKVDDTYAWVQVASG